MLQSEKNQPDHTFISAGRKAYMIGVHIQDNPYILSYYRNLWETGYRQAKRFLEPKSNGYTPRETDRRRREHKTK